MEYALNIKEMMAVVLGGFTSQSDENMPGYLLCVLRADFWFCARVKAG